MRNEDGYRPCDVLVIVVLGLLLGLAWLFNLKEPGAPQPSDPAP